MQTAVQRSPSFSDSERAARELILQYGRLQSSLSCTIELAARYLDAILASTHLFLGVLPSSLWIHAEASAHLNGQMMSPLLLEALIYLGFLRVSKPVLLDDGTNDSPSEEDLRIPLMSTVSNAALTPGDNLVSQSLALLLLSRDFLLRDSLIEESQRLLFRASLFLSSLSASEQQMAGELRRRSVRTIWLVPLRLIKQTHLRHTD